MKRDRRRVHRSHHSSLSELNITPLLDLVFVLLVIFIITTPQLTNNLELNLPTGQPMPQASAMPKINTVIVTEQGRIQLNNQQMTLAQFKVALAQMKIADPNTGVVVHGAGDADYQRVIDVLDVFHQLQITKVGLFGPQGNTRTEVCRAIQIEFGYIRAKITVSLT
jgi:biopolymer transport protein ExbD